MRQKLEYMTHLNGNHKFVRTRESRTRGDSLSCMFLPITICQCFRIQFNAPQTTVWLFIFLTICGALETQCHIFNCALYFCPQYNEFLPGHSSHFEPETKQCIKLHIKVSAYLHLDSRWARQEKESSAETDEQFALCLYEWICMRWEAQKNRASWGTLFSFSIQWAFLNS